MMKYPGRMALISLMLLMFTAAPAPASADKQVPVKGMVTMLDLGADRCIPCKLMKPILEELKAEYEGRVAVIFFDVWKDPAPARKFKVRMIPTQIFYDAQGNQVYRHEGFLSKERIVNILVEMGVGGPKKN